MRRSALIAISLAALAVTGCSDVRKSIGYDKSAPDEFAVVARAPLTIPPEYSLAPPTPGAPRPQKGTTTDDAKRVLTGRDTTAKAREINASSPGQSAFIKKVGGDMADPEIRRTVDSESSALAMEDANFTDKLMFWHEKTPADYSDTLDAEKEMQRLKENQALGDPATQGETPKIERKQKGMFEGLFN
ncbi:MAG: hypothetical protein A2516_00420 [Alphaproteobacteria bacterium RIFOXYD12_FULL_60_8]|nr:MAG: hypothetical protein A2516_00420 [Alphaproteobacteria bacterium RIFOXYD12_FULL_60_8]